MAGTYSITELPALILEVLPGIEPGFRDSESPVITVTLQDPSGSYAPDITLSKKNVLTIHLGKFRGIYDRDANT